nr:hypothetical protein Itr_chr04CG02250 [Ipomoea trifida]
MQYSCGVTESAAGVTDTPCPSDLATTGEAALEGVCPATESLGVLDALSGRLDNSEVTTCATGIGLAPAP